MKSSEINKTKKKSTKLVNQALDQKVSQLFDVCKALTLLVINGTDVKQFMLPDTMEEVENSSTTNHLCQIVNALAFGHKNNMQNCKFIQLTTF